MSKIWEFFENLEEYVYVTDPETHELLYMNKKTLKSYGFQSNDEIVGLKCYEILQGNSVPCSMCNNEQLRPGYFKEWEYYNPHLNRQLHIKDTLVEEDGRMLRMEIALDCGCPREREENPQEYRKLEAAVNEGIKVALRQGTPDQTIQVLLEYLGRTLEAERTYIFEKNDHGYDDNTYEWVARGVTAEKENLQDLPPEICAGWYRIFSQNRNIIAENVEGMKQTDPQMYEVLVRQNIRSLVVVPLYDEGRIIGFYGVDNPPTKYLKVVTDMLQIMGHFMVSSMKRRNLVHKLQQMSYTDPLTSFGNRYAMERYVREAEPGDLFGVVYCDITGLKKVNDEQGHSAGDLLILHSCDCLAQIFSGCGLFRIGGDELVVLSHGMGGEELEQKTAELKKIMTEHQVNLAVGASIETLGENGTDDLLTEAERRMYIDKAEYYHRTGLNRRKM